MKHAKSATGSGCGLRPAIDPAERYIAHRWLPFVLLSLLAACAAGPQPVPPAAPEASQPVPGAPTPAVTPAPAATVTSPAERLLREARAACEAGDIQQGLARLDRALRIEAADATLYLEMAHCYRRDGDAQRAAAAAERGLAYCTGATCRALREFL